MSGMMRTMVSPSISSSRRSTPCVDGCCGPMFRTIVWSCDGSSTGVGFMCAISDTLDGIVLAERMAFPVFRHHDARQVGMAIEANAEQVEDLALEEVRARPDGVSDSMLASAPEASPSGADTFLGIENR